MLFSTPKLAAFQKFFDKKLKQSIIFDFIHKISLFFWGKFQIISFFLVILIKLFSQIFSKNKWASSDSVEYV